MSASEFTKLLPVIRATLKRMAELDAVGLYPMGKVVNTEHYGDRMKLAELKENKGDADDAVKLADDIALNWMSMEEDELLAFLKQNISSTWMSYLQKYPDGELEDLVSHAYYIAQNN